MNTTTNDETSKQIINEMKAYRSEVSNRSSKKGEEEEVTLPEGQIAASEETENAQVEAVEPESKEESEIKAPTKAKEDEEEETLIRIGDKEFKSQADALKYAESLEYEKLAGDNYNRGIQDAMQAIRPQEPQVQEEDDFVEKFYSNPKETLKAVKDQATQEAIAQIKKEQTRESLWNQFLTENPDLRRKDAQRVLEENWETLGKITDLPKAMKLLAVKTRAEYQEIAERLRPRTELPNKGGQAVSAGSATPPGVTRAQKEATSPNFIAEMKKMKRR